MRGNVPLIVKKFGKILKGYMKYSVISAFGRPRLRDFIWTTIAVGLVIAVGWFLQQFLPRENLLLVFLLPILFAAARYGLWPSLYTVALSWICYNFFFIDPIFTLNVYARGDIGTLLFFPIIALVIGNMAAQLISSETERLRSALLSSISHDLRTPLASIVGSATTLQDIGKNLPVPANKELLDNILDEAERLNRFIQNLLDMTKLEHGNLKPRQEWVEFRDIMGRAMKRLTKETIERKISIDPSSDFSTLCVDPVLMEQVFVNILDNAVKHTPSGTPVEISFKREGKKAVITIADQGSGIPENERELVFDMFYRVRSGDAKGAGTGLGLAICRGLIEAQSGTIRAESGRMGKGTAMVITFPVEMAGGALVEKKRSAYG